MTAPEMRMRSGQEDSTDPVIALLYVIMRDHLPAADIEQAVETVIGGTLYEFTNGWDRIRGARPLGAKPGKIEARVMELLRDRGSR